MADDLFMALPLLRFPLLSDEEVVRLDEARATRVLDPASLDLLDACDEFRSLEDHARVAAEGLPEEAVPVLRERLAALAAEGFLISRNDVLRQIREAPPEAPPPPISVVGVLPGADVDGLRAHLRRHGHALPLVAVDAAQAKAFRAALAREAGFVPDDGLNLFLLHAAGDLVFLVGPAAPFQPVFFPDAAPAPLSLGQGPPGANPGLPRLEEVDLLGRHALFLGRSLRDVAARGVDLAGLDRRFLRCFQRGEGRIALTQGDVAYAVPVLETPEIDQLLTAGLDLRGEFPPFPPGDGGRLHAALLRACFPRSLGLRLPWSLLSGEPEPAPLFDVLGLAVQALDLGPFKPDGRERLDAMGRHLREFAALPPEDFEDNLRRLLWMAAAPALDLLERDLQDLGDSPQADACRRERDALREALATDSIVRREELEATRRKLEGLGRLLCAWPDLIEAAKALRRKS